MKHTHRTSNLRDERRRLLGRSRMRRLRERAKKHRHDPVSYFPVLISESVIDRIVAELRVRQADDVPVDDRTWRSLVGQLIAAVVTSALGKKK